MENMLFNVQACFMFGGGGECISLLPQPFCFKSLRHYDVKVICSMLIIEIQ